MQEKRNVWLRNQKKPTMSLVSRSANRSPTLDSGVSYSQGNEGMQSQYSDVSGIGKLKAQNVKDVNDNTPSSSQVRHQNRNTRAGIEKSIAKGDQRSSIGKLMVQIQNRLTEKKVDPSQLPDLRRPIPQKVFANARQKSESSGRRPDAGS